MSFHLFQSFFLHPDQAGVFVAVFDVTQLIDRMTHSIEFFISYEISGQPTDAKMTMYAGQIDIDAESLYGGESIMFKERAEGGSIGRKFIDNHLRNFFQSTKICWL